MKINPSVPRMADSLVHGIADIEKCQAREFKRKGAEKGKWEELFLQRRSFPRNAVCFQEG